MISKEEIIPKLNQQVCKHKSSKVDEFQCYRYVIASYNCYQKYSLALSAVLFCLYVNSFNLFPINLLNLSDLRDLISRLWE